MAGLIYFMLYAAPSWQVVIQITGNPVGRLLMKEAKTVPPFICLHIKTQKQTFIPKSSCLPAIAQHRFSPILPTGESAFDFY